MEIWQVLLWGIVAIILAIAEIASIQLIAVWFAAGSFVAFIMSFFISDFRLQIVAFIVVSVILLLATRPFVKKYINGKKIATNADVIIGGTAVVTEEVDNLHSTGRILVNGLSWAARSANDDVCLPVDSLCVVTALHGVHAIVIPQAPKGE